MVGRPAAVADAAAAVHVDGTRGVQVVAGVSKLQIAREGGRVLQAHRDMQHAVGRPGEAREAMKTALHIHNAAVGGQQGHHGVDRDVGGDVGDPHSGEGLRQSPAMRDTAAGGDPGHAGVQAVNGGVKNVVGFHSDQQLLEGMVDVKIHDLHRRQLQFTQQKITKLRDCSSRFHSLVINYERIAIKI
jgi:hypothetical protein